jgi:DNA-binding NarL/FixJ family response regulator
MPVPRLLIADDHRAVTEGLVQLLGKRFEILATIHDGGLVVEAVLRLQPDVTLLDLSMPNVNGFDALRQIKKRDANIKIIILTMYQEAGLAIEALKLGASGFVLKHKSDGELLTALEAVLSGDTYVALDLREEIRAFTEGVGVTSRLSPMNMRR